MKTNRNTLRFYIAEIKHHVPTFVLAFIFMPLTAIGLDVGLPYFLSLAVGDLASGNTSVVSTHLVLAAIAGVGGLAANIIGLQSLVRHESRVRTRLYMSTFSKLLAKDLQFFVNEKVGALTSRFIDFTRSHIVIQDLIIIRTTGFALALLIGLIIVSVNSLALGLLLLVLVVIILIEVRIFTAIRKPYRQKRKKLVAEIHGEVADAITNSLMVKTFAHEKLEIRQLKKHLLTLQKVFVKDISLFGIDGSVRITTMVIAQIIGISLAVYLVSNGQLSLAIAIFALTYLQRLASQIFSLGELINGYDEAFLQAAPMSDILMQPNTVSDTSTAQDHTIVEPTIAFNNVDYRYKDKTANVLKNISITIPAGQKVGLVGPSGAGKTTITHLLLRFYDVTDGSIIIDGLDIRDYTQRSLRQQIAYVPQEPLLFHRSLRENIAYGQPSASTEEIIEAARKANALEFIQALPDGFDTLVGERGVKLSGGQRQRVAIARAILKQAPILILDEATSALDSESEQLIQQSLTDLMADRTSIVIAHRLSTIAKLDRILVLNDGEIIEDGSHQDLLAKGGMYANLWSHQSGGFIDE